jgi:predicted MFS family arabinose efflux permease
MAIDLGMFIGAILWGFIADASSLGFMYLCAAIPAVIAGIIFLVNIKKFTSAPSE